MSVREVGICVNQAVKLQSLWEIGHYLLEMLVPCRKEANIELNGMDVGNWVRNGKRWDPIGRILNGSWK